MILTEKTNLFLVNLSSLCNNDKINLFITSTNKKYVSSKQKYFNLYFNLFYGKKKDHDNSEKKDILIYITNF